MRHAKRLMLTVGAFTAVLLAVIAVPAEANGDPHAVNQENVQESLRDNSGSRGCTLDHLVVGIPDQTTVNVQVTPDNTWDEKDTMQRGAGTALCASKATFGWYPTVERIHVDVMTEFQDVRGNKTTEAADQLNVTAPNAARFNYNEMSNQLAGHPANMYCAADSYVLHPAIWKKLDSDARGCMPAPTNP